MVNIHHVEGYDDFSQFMENFDSSGKLIHVYFSGSKEGPKGQSWCDDCIRAWPVVERELEKVDPDSHFIYVEVGDRLTWKDPNCPFRKDPKTRLMVLPTILRWQGHQKLQGDQLEKAELLSMLFTDNDEDSD